MHGCSSLVARFDGDVIVPMMASLPTLVKYGKSDQPLVMLQYRLRLLGDFHDTLSSSLSSSLSPFVYVPLMPVTNLIPSLESFCFVILQISMDCGPVWIHHVKLMSLCSFHYFFNTTELNSIPKFEREVHTRIKVCFLFFP